MTCNMEAIILAWWLGTRLSSVISNIPKPMANIWEKPFLSYIFDILSTNHIDKIILSVWYKHEIISDFFGDSYKWIPIEYSIEKELLWTWWAVQQALSYTTEDNILVMNGDTYFNIDLKKFINQHIINKADISIALKSMSNFERYGNVILDWNQIIDFEEKKFTTEGYINWWIYCIKKSYITTLHLPHIFSLESDLLTKYCQKNIYKGFIYDNYFIDIGIPEDYNEAKNYFNAQ